ncbi:orotate phosphoribosyltransferase [Candidatus Ishikawella capsulata]|uniref:Orotate phosphoribosyltransferase n=1 Tax=Candidatus Ishikawaella capsulata Mpkobe TaxID=476281 RepID=C5WDS4_9ENTR|nr:orotate phosphoribosyltransferase [Candidatus Ishikawaella capsulata]BAH83480.1 orotate phosphoribosyltransferase [Candidatus Ishikawaella capsulata Mpkobe]
MKAWQDEFIKYIIDKGILQFGNFTLKSNRQSPYFFNAGLFNSGAILAKLGYFYAKALLDFQIDCDLLFGVAYKGIPLVATTVISLSNDYKYDIPYCFNRKEIKSHGEGGIIVGSLLQGRVILLDDVITSGSSIHESVDLIKSKGAELVGVLIALDRQEYGNDNNMSAVKEIQNKYKCKVNSLINLSDIISYIEQKPEMLTHLKKLREYKKIFGI